MQIKNEKVAATRVIRWHNSDWAYVGEVAKSVGLSRSAFVKQAALLAARATEAGLSAYSVGGATATPQNTPTNHFDRSIAQQGSGRNGGGREPNPISPGGDHRADCGAIGAEGGGSPTNGAKTKANKAKSSRS